jgi:hypothetical protein
MYILETSYIFVEIESKKRENRPPCTINEGGAIDEQEEKKKGASTVDRKEERLSDERKKVPLDEMKKGVHPYGKRG